MIKSNLTYKIPSSSDIKNGFLNMCSTLYPFIIDEKLWMSIEHYRLAKRFEGSTLEDTIRKTQSVSQARLLARPKHLTFSKDGVVKKETRYGPNGTAVIRLDWTQKDYIFIEEAVIAKFSNKRLKARLLSTEGIKFIDEECPGHALALEKARDYFLQEKKFGQTTVKERIMPNQNEDIKGSKYLEIYETKKMQSILKLTVHMKKLECISKGQPITTDILYDASYNMILEDPKSILKSVFDWLNIITWDIVVEKMPKFESITNQISSILGDSVSSGDRLRFALQLAALIKWNREEPILKDSRPKAADLIIPPMFRTYRSNPPKFIVRKTSKSKTPAPKILDIDGSKTLDSESHTNTTSYIEIGKRYIELFEKYTRHSPALFSTLVKHFDNMASKERNVQLDQFASLSNSEKQQYIERLSQKNL